MQVEHDASVHPASVTEISRRELDRRQTRRFYGRQVSGQITATQVHPLAWQAALMLADGDPRRLEVIDEWHVDIHNDPDWRRTR